MKRFLGLAVAAVFAGAFWAQVAAAQCAQDGAAFCQFAANAECYEMTEEYSSAGAPYNCGKEGQPKCTCEQILANCEANGYGFYKGVTGLNADNGYGATVSCTQQGGTAVGTSKQEYGCCNWSEEGSKCYAITDQTKVAACKSGGNVYWESSCGDKLSDDSRSCPTSTPTYNGKDEVCGKWCYWPADGAGSVAGCFEIVKDDGGTCDDAISNCNSYSPKQESYNSEAACRAANSDAVRFVGSKAAVPGLKVSYAKNRVTVNWTPSAKISSGTVQLLNAKGVALSTSYIKANSGKVTAKLGTVGVPAGMYFVHISAVGVNGQKIVTQSAVSIVK